jgi:RNA polymerase sigma-70 factor, ECF subfamily
VSTNEGDQLSELMRRHGMGESDAFEPLYRLLAPRLYRFCLRLSGARTDADDLLQDTFLRLHRARATYVAGTNVLYWAYAIARSAFIDKLRYRRRRPEDLGLKQDVAEGNAMLADERDQPEAEVLAGELWDVVRVELAKMSEKNRAAYILVREEGLSFQEAAAVLGTTAIALRQRLHRVYERLENAVAAAR